MKTAIVTGATGFIGIHLIEQLLKNGYYVYAIIRPHSEKRKLLSNHVSLAIIEMDLMKLSQLPDVIKDGSDKFFHLAWEGTRTVMRNDVDLQKGNYQAAINALHIAKKLRCNTFIGSGSQSEYGNVNSIIYEKYPPKPLTEYGKAKLRTYEYGKIIAVELNIRFVWPRFFSIYGPQDYKGTLIMSCLKKMLKNQPIPLTECVQTWDYLYVADAAKAMLTLAETSSAYGVYNVASGLSRPLRDFVMEIKEILCSQSMLNFGSVPYSSEGPINLHPSIKRLQTEINWVPETSFSQGIQNILKVIENETNN